MAAHHRFSQKSSEKLDTCHGELRVLFKRVLEVCPLDITIIEGMRSNERQQELYDTGMSKLQAGQSKHNVTEKEPLSRAVDVAPLTENGIEWENRELWLHFGGYVKGVAREMGIPIRWGGDWDGDFSFKDQTFHDMPHFELGY